MSTIQRTVGFGFGWCAWRRIICALVGMVGVWVSGAPAASEGRADRAAYLRREIARHDELYFKRSAPEISDAEYDTMKRELIALDGAAEAATGDDRTDGSATGAHVARMRGLNKAYDESGWRAFHDRTCRALGGIEPRFVIEPKYDGLAISLTYERGRLTRALTRGDGVAGEDVTPRVRDLSFVPLDLGGAPASWPERVELRGEVFVAYAEFSRVNQNRTEAGAEPFAHPRTLAVGALKSSGRDAEWPELSLVLYDWGVWDGVPAPGSQQAFCRWLREHELPAPPLGDEMVGADAVWERVVEFGAARATLPFPVDGAVVKVDDVVARLKLGADDHAPRWAIACKFAPESAQTRLREIVLQVGRTGVVTPVAVFDPVRLGGAVIERASLHNRANLERRDYRLGDLITVEKAGEIIPVVGAVVAAQRPSEARPFVFPVHCPACGEALDFRDDRALVRCLNRQCPAQRQRRLEHFAASVGIRGAGPETIRRLIDAGLLLGAGDFFALTKEKLWAIDGIGPEVGQRLTEEIERARRAPLWKVLVGLGIPGIGPTRARVLAGEIKDLQALENLPKQRIRELIGSVGAESLLEFLGAEENQADFADLIVAGVGGGRSGARSGDGSTAKVRGRLFVFTGSLPGISREAAVDRVLAAGGVVRTAVSGQTDYLVAGNDPGSKLERARQLGVTVLDMTGFERLLSEH